MFICVFYAIDVLNGLNCIIFFNIVKIFHYTDSVPPHLSIIITSTIGIREGSLKNNLTIALKDILSHLVNRPTN